MDFHEVDDVSFAHIAFAAVGIAIGCICLGAVLFDADKAIWLQQVTHSLYFGVGDVPVHDVVHHTHDQYAVERSFRAFGSFA